MAKIDTWLTEQGLITLKGLARKGLSDADIAKAIGVSRSTLMLWKKQNKAISDALRDGKLHADMTVENALYQKACGYSYQEVKEVAFKDKNTGELLINKREVVTKHIPGDVVAQKYWLNNRRPTDWKERVIEQGDDTENQLSQFFDALQTNVVSTQIDVKDDDDTADTGGDNDD